MFKIYILILLVLSMFISLCSTKSNTGINNTSSLSTNDNEWNNRSEISSIKNIISGKSINKNDCVFKYDVSEISMVVKKYWSKDCDVNRELIKRTRNTWFPMGLNYMWKYQFIHNYDLEEYDNKRINIKVKTIGTLSIRIIKVFKINNFIGAIIQVDEIVNYLFPKEINKYAKKIKNTNNKTYFLEYYLDANNNIYVSRNFGIEEENNNDFKTEQPLYYCYYHEYIFELTLYLINLGVKPGCALNNRKYYKGDGRDGNPENPPCPTYPSVYYQEKIGYGYLEPLINLQIENVTDLKTNQSIFGYKGVDFPKYVEGIMCDIYRSDIYVSNYFFSKGIGLIRIENDSDNCKTFINLVEYQIE